MQTQAKKDDGKPCNCQHPQAQVGTPAADTLARIQMSPHQDAVIRIRLIPGRDVALPNPDPCGFGQVKPGVSSLSPALIDKLKASDKQVTSWLAKSSENARLFFADPVAALAKAGVELDRSENKAIVRAHANASQEAVVMPGVRLTEVAITATDRRPTGKTRGDGGGRKPASDSSNCCAKEN